MTDIDLSDRGMEALAKSAAVAALVAKAAEEVADNVRSQGIRVQGIPGDVELPVKVSTYETDRARASVTLAHPAGLAVQAKHGALSRAAASAGLDVNAD
jgi:hypothetical protein